MCLMVNLAMLMMAFKMRLLMTATVMSQFFPHEDESVNENNQGLAESDDAVSQGGAAVSVPTGGTPRAAGTMSTEVVLTK